MINKLLNVLALKITDMVATMWCAIIFTLIALISLPEALKSHDLIVMVSWLAQTFLQLVLLSIIMVGQKLQGDNVDRLHSTIKRHHKEHLSITKQVHKLIVGRKA